VTHSVIVDAGPLVAALAPRDQAHQWVTAHLKELPYPFLVCEPVLVEAAYLLRRYPGSTDRILSLVASGFLRLVYPMESDVDALRALIRKYADQPMSLADACVVRMAEVFDDHAVFTLDTDFAVYRTSRNQPIRLIAP
jgi:predicted nucleic acid-binding protein